MKINPALTGGMSGSAGGITASRNRFGQYLRRRAQPVNPRTDAQQGIRANFASAVVTWSALEQSQQTAWTTYAANTPRIDPLGNSVVLTGQNAYLGAYVLNRQAIALGGSPTNVLADAPTIYNAGSPLEFASPIIMTSTPEFSATIAANWIHSQASATGVMIAYQGRPQNASRTFYKGPYRAIGVSEPFMSGAASVNIDITDEAAFPFGITLNTIYPMRYVVLYSDNRHPTALEVFVEVVPAT